MIEVFKINGFQTRFKGDSPTLLLFYRDRPGMIAEVANIIADEGINIASLYCSRKQRGKDAFMQVDVDSPLSQRGAAAHLLACRTLRTRGIWTEFPETKPMIESFKHLEELAADRDLADVFLETDEQEHAVPAEQIVEALRKRRAVMRDCVERGKSSGGESMGKLVGNEARLLQRGVPRGAGRSSIR